MAPVLYQRGKWDAPIDSAGRIADGIAGREAQMRTSVYVGLTFALLSGSLSADTLLLVGSDASGTLTATQQAFMATGKFTAVNVFDAQTGTPSPNDLNPYTDVLAWTNLRPQDGIALGNALASFYDQPGKHLTIATYALTNPGGIGGTVAAAPYAAWVDTGNFGTPTGSLVAVVPNDPIFSGITLANVHYYLDWGFANSGLGMGAQLLATDGNGLQMIARSANGVIAVNLYPGLMPGSANNTDFYNLLANTFPPSTTTPVAPTANAGGPYSFCPQSKPWFLDGSHSTDPELGLSDPGSPADKIIEYAWDMSGTNNFTDASGVQPDVTAFFTGLGPGLYPVQLRVTSSTAASFPSSGLANLTGTAGVQVLVKNSCTCITTLSAVANGNGKIQLTWPLTGSNHYNIYRSTVSGGSYAPIATVNSTTYTYLDGGVTPGTTYYYIVREANLANVETCQSNEASAVPVADTTPAITTLSALPGPNGQGWNNSNVTVSLTAVDNPGGSGVQQITIQLSGAQSGSSVVPGNTASVTVAAEGTTTLTYFSTDQAGNAEAPKTLVLLIDKTPPTATATPNPHADAYGWNGTDVTVTFSGTDGGSGLSGCTAPVTFTNSGAGQIAKGICVDNAGNQSAPAAATVNILKDPPTILGVPAAGACVLWPPDHKLIHVATLSVQGVLMSTFNVTATSNEPADPGRPDIVIHGTGLDPREIELRAERSGRGQGRIYTVNATATNQAGSTETASFTCTVPHDGRDGDHGNSNQHY